MPPKRHQQEDNVDSWLMSYADMITLLLGFFIIFVSVSEPKKEKLSAIREGVQGKFGVVELASPFDGVFRDLRGIIEKKDLLAYVAVDHTDKSLTLELSTLAFFEPKSADLDAERIPLLEEIAERMKAADYLDAEITIEGHTSDLPIFSDEFPTNWELASARATHLVRFFIDHGIAASRMRAVSFGEARPKVPNTDLQGKPIEANQKQNERVLIRLERNS